MVECKKVKQEGEVAVSQDFIGIANVNVSDWNLEKSLSDHKGIVTEICF